MAELLVRPGTPAAAWPVTRRSRRIRPPLLRRGVGPYLLVGDLVAVALATAATGPPSTGRLLVLPVLALVAWRLGLYRSRLLLSILEDLPALTTAVVASWSLALAVRVTAGGADLTHGYLVLPVSIAAVVVVRWCAYRTVSLTRRYGLVRHRTLIVGSGAIGSRLARALITHRRYGLEPVGFVDSDVSRASGILPRPLLGGYDALARVIHEHGVSDVVVAFGGAPESDLVDILRTCDRMDVEVFIVPRLFELHRTSRSTDEIWGVPLVRVRRAAYGSPWWPVKRLVDVVVSGGTLVLLSPVLLACALAVRLEGGPGVIFRQERVGLDGRPFQVLKFRSLRPADEAESRTNWNIRHDDRLGPVGRFLRSTSLDELPQLWNIVRGDMSLVGPRPERPHFVQQFSAHIPRYTARHRVPAGLTGWAQVHGLRGDTSIEERARFDNYYIENWSPWLDVRIVVRTVGQVLQRQGG